MGAVAHHTTGQPHRIRKSAKAAQIFLLLFGYEVETVNV